MAIVDRNTLKNWYKRGDKPLASQFADWIDSYWHKTENIPASRIDGLQEALNDRAYTEVLNNEIAERIAADDELLSQIESLPTAVQPDWNQSDDEELDFIKNKPGIATSEVPGLMSSSDKTKLDGIADGADANVQSDWDQDDDTADDFIKNKPSVGGVSETDFTFIIDSNAKLNMWATNAAGNDYSIVLVKAGTYTSNTPVNLTTTQTKIVVGQKGNLLSFTGEHGLLYDALPVNDCWMRGVNVRSYKGMTAASYINMTVYAYEKCINLDNCTAHADVYGYSTNNSNVFVYARGFDGCANLANCRGEAGGAANGGAMVAKLASGRGFNNCINLFRCFGKGLNSRDTCFYDCQNLIECHAEHSQNFDSIEGFNNCGRLINCIANVAVVTASVSDSVGFLSCKYLFGCKGTASATSSYSGFGFANCRVLFGCGTTEDALSSTATYGDCYMHLTGTDDPVDDTAAGGYNTPATGANPDAGGGGDTNVQSDWNQTNNTADDFIKNKPSNATTTTTGLMSSSDKTKLDGIADGADANVQSDWNQTDNTADDYIKNKPTISAGGGDDNVQSDWNQTDNTADDYIKNKPTIRPIWTGTEDQYDAIATKDTNTIYMIFNDYSYS
jgi:hypothetical protein